MKSLVLFRRQDIAPRIEPAFEFAPSRRALLLAGTTLAAASVLDVVGTIPAAQAAENAPKPSPEHIKQMEQFTESLATQAAIYGAPLVAMYLLRQSVCFGDKPKAAPGEIWRIKDITTPAIAEQAGYVTNVNVVYGFGFMDLGREPVILSVPDSKNRYYMVEICDMWSNAFAYTAGVARGYKGGTFVGPGWKGILPAGVTRIDAPTRWVELQPRVHVKNQDDLVEAERVLNAITVKGLSEHTGGGLLARTGYIYLSPKINPHVASSMLNFEDPVQFWETFSTAMNENPPPTNEIKTVLPQFKSLGIELGKLWKPDDVSPFVVDVMKRVAANVGAMSVGIMPLLGKLSNGWVIPSPNVGTFGADYPGRAAVAVFGLTANTVKEAIYYAGVLDGNHEQMTGAKKYTMHFKKPMHYLQPQPPGFWSLTMYDGVSRLTLSSSRRNSTSQLTSRQRMRSDHDTAYPARTRRASDRAMS
jgi:hypothetical protein